MKLFDNETKRGENMKNELLMDIVDRYEQANYTINHILNVRIKENLPSDLTMEQLSILRYLYRVDVSTPSELADAMCVGKSTITSIITRMVNKELIERVPSEHDRRVIHLKLTEEGKRQFDELDEVIHNILLPYLNKVEKEEAEQLITILEKLVQVLNDHE